MTHDEQLRHDLDYVAAAVRRQEPSVGTPSIYFLWAPAHDEWLHRRGEPLHLGIRVQRRGMIERFFSTASRRVTPPPRVTHR